MSRLLLFVALGGIAGACAHVAPPAPDPVTTDPDKYAVVLENDCVRVLRYHDKPGDQTRLHRHTRFVMFPLAPFRRQLTFPDGRQQVREFRAEEAVWIPAQTHIGRNVGTTTTETLLVEVKDCPDS